MTLFDLRKTVQDRLESAGGVPYTDAQINAALNEAQSLFAFLTLCVQRSVEIVLTPERPVWNIAADVTDWLVPLRVRCRRYQLPQGLALWNQPLFDETLWNEGAGEITITETRVRPVTLSQLEAEWGNWRALRGNTVARYGCQGFDYFFISPAPTDGNTKLSITYAAQAQQMTSDADVSEVPAEDDSALVSGALALLPLAYGGSELAQFDGEWTLFLTTAQKRAAYVRARSRSLEYDTIPTEIRLADVSRKPRKDKAA